MKNKATPIDHAKIINNISMVNESFQRLKNDISNLIAVLPDSEKDIIKQKWSTTIENFEQLSNKYLQNELH